MCDNLYSKVERQVKVPIKYLALILLPQQEVSADNIQNSAVGNISPKSEGTKDKSSLIFLFSDVFSLPVHFEFFANFSFLKQE